MGERTVRIRKVEGSNPFISTKKERHLWYNHRWRSFNEINSSRNLWSIPKEYEVAVAMKYASHIGKGFIFSRAMRTPRFRAPTPNLWFGKLVGFLLHVAVITATLHNEQSELLHTCHLQVLHFTLHPLENLPTHWKIQPPLENGTIFAILGTVI